MKDGATAADAFGEGDHMIPTNGIRLHVTVAGQGPAVVLVHGFPDFGYTWRKQVPALVAAGYRVIVPDMRGSGLSDRPEAVNQYGADIVAKDLMGILDALGEESAAFVGHDWGASIVWFVAAAHQDRVDAVCGMAVPVMRPAPAPPISMFRRKFGEDFYMVRIQEPGVVDGPLNANPRRSANSIWKGEGLEPDAKYDDPNCPLPFYFEQADLDAYADAYSISGFTGGLNYYRNIDRNWELWKTMEQISAPVMFVTGSLDASNANMPATDLDIMCKDVRVNEVLEGVGHMIQVEHADGFNTLLLSFLADVYKRSTAL